MYEVSLHLQEAVFETNERKVTFSIAVTKAFAEPMADTHNMMVLLKAPKGSLELIFATSKKCEGVILVKKIGRDSLTSRIICSISLRFCSETCAISKHKFYFNVIIYCTQ